MLLLRKLRRNPSQHALINNTGWLFVDRTTRIAVVLVVAMSQARYLGPVQYGLLSYATAIVSLFAVVGQLGLNNLIIREIVIEPEKRYELLGTAFWLQLLGNTAALCFSVGAVFLLNPGDNLVHGLVAIISVGPILGTFSLIEYWFQSQIKSGLTLLARGVSYILEPILVIGLISAEASLIALASVSVIVLAINSVGFLMIYRVTGESIQAWRFSGTRAWELLRAGGPLMLAALAVVVYFRVDQILIKQLVGNEALGLYSAAVRISEVWYFVPTVIVASVFPVLIDAKKNSEQDYMRRFYELFRLLMALSLLFGILVTFLSKWVIAAIYGAEYETAGLVLAIHVWAGIPVAMGVSTSSWLIAEGYTQIALHRTLFGVAVNVVLNLLLLPKYSILGAAIATIVAYTCAGLLWHFVDRRTRNLAVMQVRALLLFLR